MRVYQQGDYWVEGEYPTILAIGDSWFWYPRNNILEALVRNNKLDPNYAFVQALGKNGALLSEYIPGGRFADALAYHLSPNVRHYFTGFLISGAGNDAVDYKLALKSDCTNIQDPAACLDPARLGELLRGVRAAIDILVLQIRTAYQGETGLSRPIFLHGYDYAIPDGRGFHDPLGLVHSGPWLKPAMDAAGVNPDLAFRTRVVHELIDRLNVVLHGCANPAAHVHYIDSRGTLSSGEDYTFEWANELHPTSLGFNRIVEERWMPVFAGAGYATTTPAHIGHVEVIPGAQPAGFPQT